MRFRLIAAFGSVRLTLGRLAGFPYASPEKRFRRFAVPIGALRSQLESAISGRQCADAALLYLDSRQHLEKAVAKLEKARYLDSRNAIIASDLAAVYLERGRNSDSAHDLIFALAQAEAATALDPQLPEAKFNLALALEKLTLNQQAIVAWKKYISIETSQDWVREAHAHLGLLARIENQAHWRLARAILEHASVPHDAVKIRSIVSEFRQDARLYAEQELLPRWAAAQVEGHKQEARSPLALATVIGNQYSALTGDRFLADSVAAIDRTISSGKVKALSQGHLRFFRAVQEYERYHPQAAAAAFAEARRDFERGGSPFQFWDDLYLAMCEYQLHRYSSALRRLDKVQYDTNSSQYTNLAGRTEWMRGLIYYLTTQPLIARQCYVRALSYFEKTGETGSQASIQGLLFELYDFLGEDDEAWRCLYRALTLTDQVVGPRQHQRLAQEAALAAQRAGWPLAAIYFDNEAVKWAEVTGSHVAIALARRDRALLNFHAGRFAAATRDIAVAKQSASKGDDADIQAEVQLASAEVLSNSDRKEAFQELSAALPIFENTHFDLRLTSVYLQRGRLAVATGQPIAALKDFRAGLNRLEHEIRDLNSLERGSYLERATELLDELVGLEYDTESDPRPRAFASAELGREFGLAGSRSRFMGDIPSRRDLALLKRALPEGVTLIEYAVLPTRLLAWIVSRNETRSVVLPVSSVDLRKSIIRLKSAIQTSDDVLRISGALYKQLIDPLQLPPGQELVIVPDKSLHQLPFAALYKSQSGRYLIEDRTLVMVPSASFYLGTLKAHPSLPSKNVEILIVADPAFDRTEAPALQALPWAKKEVDAIAKIYGSVAALTGIQATRKSFLYKLGKYRIIEFSGHAEVDERSPLYSRFLLAPTKGDNGVLFARDLYGRNFAGTDLMILSACGTAAVSLTDSEGFASLARPFLAGGVPAVIGSLWAVEDQTSAELSISLHRGLACGDNIVSALRSAQLKLLHSESRARSAPKEWAAFEIFGAGLGTLTVKPLGGKGISCLPHS